METATQHQTIVTKVFGGYYSIEYTPADSAKTLLLRVIKESDGWRVYQGGRFIRYASTMKQALSIIEQITFANSPGFFK